MALKPLISTLALVAAMAAPAAAQDHERRHQTDAHPAPPPQQPAEHAHARPPQPPQEQPPVEHAHARPPHTEPHQPPQDQVQHHQDQGHRQIPPPQPPPQPRVQPRAERPPQREIAVPRGNETPRAYPGDNRVFDSRRSTRWDDDERYDARRWDYRRYESYVSGVRRYDAYIIQPEIIRVIAYRPYVYRPSYGVGYYYGDDGYYPYGYTPRGYFDPIPGRLYGGVRITGAPRDALVFADGYYVGIVDDFDGIFQHMNLEAGPHHVEVAWGGYQPIAFDVFVRPGETITFRADRYFRY